MNPKKILFSSFLAFAIVGVSASAALAGGLDNEGLTGGIGSNIESLTSTGHGSLCGSPVLGLLQKTHCIVRGHGGTKVDKEPVSGGLLSNIASVNASGHSVNCGNGNVAILTETTCISKG